MQWTPSAIPQQLKSSALESLPKNSLTPALPGIHFHSKASDPESPNKNYLYSIRGKPNNLLNLLRIQQHEQRCWWRGENTTPAFLMQVGLGCYLTDPKAPFNPILAKINGWWSRNFSRLQWKQKNHGAVAFAAASTKIQVTKKRAHPTALSSKLRRVCLRTDKVISLKKIEHTFALASDTFSWLLLLMRKNLASWRTYLSLLVWSEKKTKYQISQTVHTYQTCCFQYR